MTRDEHKKIMNELLKLATPENQAAMSEALTTLSEDYETVLTTSENNASQVQTLTANNETLREVNAKLFLKVGATDKQTVHTENNSGDGNQTQINSENEFTFDKLFNEKGELI